MKKREETNRLYEKEIDASRITEVAKRLIEKGKRLVEELDLISPKECAKCGSFLDYSTEFRLIYCVQCDKEAMRKIKERITAHVTAYEYDTSGEARHLIDRALRDWAFRTAIFRDMTPEFINMLSETKSKRPLVIQFVGGGLSLDRMITAMVSVRRNARKTKDVAFICDWNTLSETLRQNPHILVIERMPARLHARPTLNNLLKVHRAHEIDLFIKDSLIDVRSVTVSVSSFGSSEDRARGLISVNVSGVPRVIGYVELPVDKTLLEQWYVEKNRAITEFMSSVGGCVK